MAPVPQGPVAWKIRNNKKEKKFKRNQLVGGIDTARSAIEIIVSA
jgi:hypothetical protein